MLIITKEMIDAYNAEFDKRPLPRVDKSPIALAHSRAKDEVINKYGKLPTDRVLVQKHNELSQHEFDCVIKALRLLCELDCKGDTDQFCDLHHYARTGGTGTGVDENIGIEIIVYDDDYPKYGFAEDDAVVCVDCYYRDCDTDVTDWDYTLASFVVHKDFFKPTNATNATTQEQGESTSYEQGESTSYEQGESPNVNKPLPSDTCHAIAHKGCSGQSDSNEG